MTTTARAVGLGFGLALLIAPDTFAEVTFDWATIGNAGNAADPQVMVNDGTSGYGSVSSEYRIATSEVTIAQYAEFLNTVAHTDNFGGVDTNLYDVKMADQFAGITRSGIVGSYTYAVVPGRENNPAVYTSFIDAMRFTNWLHNGQGAGDTETGVYDITDGTSETRAVGAQYFIPSEDEWYKGAYHQPESQGGDSDDYWLYPTSNNSIPVAGVDANYDGIVNNTTTVGSYDANFYGLNDMGGNVMEWNESFFSPDQRVVRGGAWEFGEIILQSAVRFSGTHDADARSLGFRIASPVPGPGTALILAGGVVAVGMRRSRARGMAPRRIGGAGMILMRIKNSL